MSKSSIQFFYEIPGFRVHKSTLKKRWIQKVIEEDQSALGELSFIFCDDEQLLEINRKYLGHDFYTDIITFDHSEEKGKVSGDLFLSVERIRDNAETHRVSFQDELDRVMIHGVFHLLGYHDKSQEEQSLMRKKEDWALLLRN